MKALSTNLIIAKNTLSSKWPWLLLCELHVNDTDDTIFRWVQHEEDVTFSSNDYTAFNFELQTITYKAGEVTTTTLRLCNVTQTIKSTLRDNRGCTASEIVIYYVHANLLDEDYSELTLNFDILYPRITANYVEFKIGGPSPLRRRVPPDRYHANTCRYFRGYPTDPRCNYSADTVADVILSGTDPVKIEVTGHRAETDDEITLAGIAGITPSLDGTYTVTYVDDDNYSLQGTDSSDYSGTYTSGGTSAYAGCNGLRKNCWQRKNETMFGGFPGLLAETMRIA